MDCGDANEEFGAAKSMGILLKMQGTTHGWKYKEKVDETNIPERMQGGCDYIAGENILCATVTRKAGDVICACDDALVTVMTRADREISIASVDGASVNTGLCEVTSFTGVSTIAPNKMRHQEVEKSKKDTNLGNCMKAKQTENALKEINEIDREQS